MPDIDSDINIRFSVISRLRDIQSIPNCGYLIEDGWNDWFKYCTLYYLHFIDARGVRIELGAVKIGQFGMVSGQSRPGVPQTFSHLDEQFFSLGQDASYYEEMAKMDTPIKDLILNSLRDLVSNNDLWRKSLSEDVTGSSLMRSVSKTTVEGQFRRILGGGARLTKYSLKYEYPKRANAGELLFDVEPEAMPPTNIHVIIGRNGVGKSYLLNLMAKSLIADKATSSQSGRFTSADSFGEIAPFANLVTLSFSAFDEFFIESNPNNLALKQFYIGLRKSALNEDGPKNPELLKKEFIKSLEICSLGARLERWKRAIRMLEADPIFKDSEVIDLLDDSIEPFEERAGNLFKRLSSGHKIVLLSMTRLVELVDEKTLVLLDEPESHLHPPLLSAFIRSLSDLLINRNGVAIIATHSPVILQEVPKKCVWKIHRTGNELRTERPTIETFGENVGVLTREVFGLEVVHSGFYKIIDQSVNEHLNYEEAVGFFGYQLGSEAKAILRGLFNLKQNQ